MENSNNLSDIQSVSLEDFAKSFGTTVDEIERLSPLASTLDFRYRMLTGADRDDVLLSVINKIDNDTVRVAEPERRQIWEKGWAENLKDFEDSGHDVSAILPKFVRQDAIIRLNRDYARPLNPGFEQDYTLVLKHWLFRTYYPEISSFYEFGCGTGTNLVIMAELFSEMELHGLDFAPSSRDLINKLGEVNSWSLSGHLFDMTDPDDSIKMKPGSGVLTVGALEQLGGEIDALFDYLLKNKPSICIHMEPTLQLYETDRLVDYLGYRFHTGRNYTDNYLPLLEKLEADKRVKILRKQRIDFGSLFSDGYNFVVWRPI